MKYSVKKKCSNELRYMEDLGLPFDILKEIIITQDLVLENSQDLKTLKCLLMLLLSTANAAFESS